MELPDLSFLKQASLIINYETASFTLSQAIEAVKRCNPDDEVLEQNLMKLNEIKTDLDRRAESLLTICQGSNVSSQ